MKLRQPGYLSLAELMQMLQIIASRDKMLQGCNIEEVHVLIPLLLTGLQALPDALRVIMSAGIIGKRHWTGS